MSCRQIVLAGVAATLLAACASVPLAQRQAADAAAAGAPVNSFRFFTPLWSWEALGPDQVVIYTRPKQAWLLDVPGCNQLPFANAIGLTSNLNQVSIRFDKVIIDRNTFPCTIQKIRPVDVARLKAVQQQREVRTEPRPS
jgi:hypothetical protein